MAHTTLRAFLVKAIDTHGKRWQYNQTACSVAHAEQLAIKRIGDTRYLFVRRPS